MQYNQYTNWLWNFLHLRSSTPNPSTPTVRRRIARGWFCRWWSWRSVLDVLNGKNMLTNQNQKRKKKRTLVFGILQHKHNNPKCACFCWIVLLLFWFFFSDLLILYFRWILSSLSTSNFWLKKIPGEKISGYLLSATHRSPPPDPPTLKRGWDLLVDVDIALPIAG